jgi:hypothetical protein
LNTGSQNSINPSGKTLYGFYISSFGISQERGLPFLLSLSHSMSRKRSQALISQRDFRCFCSLLPKEIVRTIAKTATWKKLLATCCCFRRRTDLNASIYIKNAFAGKKFKLVFKLPPSVTAIFAQDYFFYQLRQTTNITEIYVNNSHWDTAEFPNVLKGFVNLTTLNASGSYHFPHLVEFVPKPAKLKELDARINTLEQVQHFSKAESLVKFEFFKEKDFRIEWLEKLFAKMNLLEELAIYYPQISESLPLSLPNCFEHMVNLRSLDLECAEFIEIGSVLCSLQSLKKLILPKVFNQPLGTSLPKNLTHLTICGEFNQPILQKEIEHLEELKHLHFDYFSRYNQPFKGALLYLKNLETLHLSNVFQWRIQGELPPNLKIVDLPSAFNNEGLPLAELPDSLQSIRGATRALLLDKKYWPLLNKPIKQ